jgi:hypothetical protein
MILVVIVLVFGRLPALSGSPLGKIYNCLFGCCKTKEAKVDNSTKKLGIFGKMVNYFTNERTPIFPVFTYINQLI